MNKINVQQTGGFPLETDTLNAMQNAYDIFNSLGNIIAPLAIVKGCEVVGTTVANGIVYIDGEILEFRGGQAAATVIIREETKNKNFENGENKIVYRTRFATFGSSVQTTNFNWSDFHRPRTIKQIEEVLNDKTVFEKLVERVSKLEVFARPFSGGGGLVFFGRPISEIPEGWKEAVDWRGRIPMHFDPSDENLNEVGELFGSKERTLTTANLPRNKYGTNFGAEIKSDGLPRYPSGYGKGDDIYLGKNEAFSILPPVKIAVFIEPIL